MKVNIEIMIEDYPDDIGLLHAIGDLVKIVPDIVDLEAGGKMVIYPLMDEDSDDDPLGGITVTVNMVT